MTAKKKKTCSFQITANSQGSEFSNYENELRNQVTQNDFKLRVTNSKSKNKNLHSEFLTRSRKMKIYTSTC